MDSVFWELYCLDHGIQPAGQMLSDKTTGEGGDFFNTSSETGAGKHVFVDLESRVTDDVHIGYLNSSSYIRKMLPITIISPANYNEFPFLCTKIDEILVYYTIGKKVFDQIWKLADQCTDH